MPHVSRRDTGATLCPSWRKKGPCASLQNPHETKVEGDTIDSSLRVEKFHTLTYCEETIPPELVGAVKGSAFAGKARVR